MIATYSRTMPLHEAVRLTFTPDNLCDVCVFVADAKTRADAHDGDAADQAAAQAGAKAKAPIAPAPVHLLVFQILPSPEWPRENFEPASRARRAPPAEPPRAA